MDTKKEKWYNDIESNIAVIIVIVMLIILTQQVFMRYIVHRTYGWSDEAARYLLIYFAYITAAIAVYKNAHIKIDLILKIWPSFLRPYLKLFSNVIFFIYCITVAYFSSILTSELYASGAISLGFGLPMWIVYASMPIGHIFMAIRLVQLEINLIKHPELLNDIEIDELSIEEAGLTNEKSTITDSKEVTK